MGFDLGSLGSGAVAGSSFGPWGAVIGAGISGLSGIAGGMINATQSKSIARAQMRLQKEFAQNGIQWRVDDARRAGIHPLYALGANTATYTPVSQDSSGLGNAVADAGAYLGKAVDMSLDKEARREIEQENLQYAMLMREGQLEEQRQRVRGLMLQNDEQEFLNARLASGVSGNPVRPVPGSMGSPDYIYDVVGYSGSNNNPAVRSHLDKVRRNAATDNVGVPLKSPVGVTPVLKKADTYFQHDDGSLEILQSEDRANSIDGLEFLGTNIPGIGYIVGRLGEMLAGRFADYRKPPKIINGKLYVWNFRNDRWYPVGDVR